MIFQPLVYFAAVIWAAGFIAFGLYVALRRATPSFADRTVGLLASVLIAAIGSSAMIGTMYLVEELL
jgi:nitric oxide reductase large subunit